MKSEVSEEVRDGLMKGRLIQGSRTKWRGKYEKLRKCMDFGNLFRRRIRFLSEGASDLEVAYCKDKLNVAADCLS